MIGNMAKQAKAAGRKKGPRPAAKAARKKAPARTRKPQAPKATRKPRASKAASQPVRRITGSVHEIVAGRQTGTLLTAEQAFSDPAQAQAQVHYFEEHGTRAEVRLARLAYRQYQGKRLRRP
jgi:hypothetical protein